MRPLAIFAASAAVLACAPAANAAPPAAVGAPWVISPEEASCRTDLELTARSGAVTPVTFASDGERVMLRFAMEGPAERAFLPIRVDQRAYANLVLRGDRPGQAAMTPSDETLAALRHGKTLQIATRTFRVVGVADDWNPQPRFYDLNDGAYGDAEQMYLPFLTWLDLPQDYGYGPMRCWGADTDAGTHDPKAPSCTWVQFWVQLDTAAQRTAYRDALVHYSLQQHELGRFERAPDVRLRGLLDWLDAKHVIPVTVRMQTWIAFGVFLICMVNTVGLMVAKFLRKSAEIGVRRALGASRRDVFTQCLVEAGLLGVAGGLLGLPLVWLGVWMVRQQPVAFARSAQVDPAMLALALAMALLATLAAGFWPSWRASRVAPALQVKSL